MVIVVRRSFPFFPVLLAIGWVLMMSLSLRDLAWFAAAGASFDNQPPRGMAVDGASAGRASRIPIGPARRTATLISPVVQCP